MRDKINQLLQDIEKKKLELKKEYEKLKEKYGFKIE
jgi:Txe/YoeB family toxin of Txe-Axe toxin-antitoxin module